GGGLRRLLRQPRRGEPQLREIARQEPGDDAIDAVVAAAAQRLELVDLLRPGLLRGLAADPLASELEALGDRLEIARQRVEPRVARRVLAGPALAQLGEQCPPGVDVAAAPQRDELAPARGQRVAGAGDQRDADGDRDRAEDEPQGA